MSTWETQVSPKGIRQKQISVRWPYAPCSRSQHSYICLAGRHIPFQKGRKSYRISTLWISEIFPLNSPTVSLTGTFSSHGDRRAMRDEPIPRRLYIENWGDIDQAPNEVGASETVSYQLHNSSP